MTNSTSHERAYPMTAPTMRMPDGHVGQDALRERLRQGRVEPEDRHRYRVPGRVACIVDAAAAAVDGAQRQHALARTLAREHGAAVMLAFPPPSTDAATSRRHARTASRELDGVRYLHLPAAAARDHDDEDDDAALRHAVASLKTILRVFKPSMMLIAASASHALAAAIAARELGLPYCYAAAPRCGAGLGHMDDVEAEIAALAAACAGAPTGRDEHDAATLSDLLRGVLEAVAPSAGAGAGASDIGQQQRNRLKQLRVAAVMDDFTQSSYAPECDLLQLTPEHALAELEGFQPELLFIESAWRGKDELWGNKVGTLAAELKGILAWCKTRGIPTVFWNKEDPVHFDTFITTANEFDHVFTTDIDCIARYKTALRHERVYLLPFAAQPRQHNPVELYERKDAFCFAGAYYTRYPERTRDLENYIAELPAFRPVEIFDRNFGKTDVNYQFPPAYQPFIVGTLAFKEIDKAYKGYRYAINLNSIKQSQTMYARRVYELLASNTITVSNFSRGIRLMFGDLVVATDDGRAMLARVRALAGAADNGGKLRLAALRKTMLEHTYAQRLAYVASKALALALAPRLAPVLVVAYACDDAEQRALLAHFARQTHRPCRLVLVHEGEAAAGPAPAVRFVAAGNAAALRLSALPRSGEWVAVMLAQDYYGPNYLLDLALASTYTDARLVGKAAYYATDRDEPVLRDGAAAYRPAPALPVRASAIAGDALPEHMLLDWLRGLQHAPDSAWTPQPNLALDPFNYCRDAAGLDPAHVARQVDDLVLDTGMHIDELQDLAERIPAHARADEMGRDLDAARLALLFGTIAHPRIGAELEARQWRIRSDLPDGKHEYLYAANELALADLAFQHEVTCHLELSPGLNVTLLVCFLDAARKPLHTAILTPNANHATAIPAGAAWLRLGLRVYGNGTAAVQGLHWRHKQPASTVVLGRQPCLVVTNQYPSYAALYSNAFVHSRLRAYRQCGLRADVFCLKPGSALDYREFEDVNVASGGADALEQLLVHGDYGSILVHFLDEAMWDVLRKFAGARDIVVWVHGADIQSWQRRAFLYPDEASRARAQAQGERRTAFWRALLARPPARFRLVFVSRHFAEETMQDLGIRLPESLYSIIHNPIDTDLFAWQPKPAAQRHRILSIRPYSSAVYANDVTVQVILALAREPWFGTLEFRLVGDGPLFEETLAPLRGYANVVIERRFLAQADIALLHREYGIFLCPSRTDTQGVSRDEAMASGLVPVTNAVAAIPEFVDEGCGMLAPPEDAAAMAAAIARLVAEPELFLALSANAARRVRRQSAKQAMTALELALIAPARAAAPHGDPS